MTHDVELPEIFPLENIIVKEERHTFEVFQGDDGPLPTTEYIIDKAPIENIREITGTLNGRVGHEFIEDVDYELSSDNERVVWLDGDRPDADTDFFITYKTESIMGRYVESASEEFESVDDQIIEATQGKFVGQADGSELDEIGKLFGDVIGKRQGRNDTQYRIYLQSVVQSFISRGTKTGIKLAISAATDVPVADITINENFETNQYEVVVIPDTAVQVSLLETIADIADPSGVSQVRTRFPIFEDLGVTDTGRATLNQFDISDELATDDAVTVPPKAADISDQFAADDAVTVPPKDAIVSDQMAADDATANQSVNIEWDNNSWDDMTWATEHN